MFIDRIFVSEGAALLPEGELRHRPYRHGLSSTGYKTRGMIQRRPPKRGRGVWGSGPVFGGRSVMKFCPWGDTAQLTRLAAVSGHRGFSRDAMGEARQWQGSRRPRGDQLARRRRWSPKSHHGLSWLDPGDHPSALQARFGCLRCQGRRRSRRRQLARSGNRTERM